ncbi:MAG: hypothetical protein V3R66_03395 [Rhodospirillales bacterium]
MYLLKIEQAAQASKIPSLIGKSFTVGKVSPVGDGINKWLVLQPNSATGSAAAKGTVMLKVEGGRQLPALVGKTVTVGKSPVLGATGTKWLALHPGAAMAKGAAGVAGAGAAGKGSLVMSVNEANGQLQALTGKTYMIGKAPVMAEGGKNMLVLNPVAAAKGSAGAAGGKAVLAKTAIAGKAVGKTMAVGTAVAAKGTAASGTIWSGTGLSLGLGLGLGSLGPALLVAGLTAGGYYLYCQQQKSARNDDAVEGDLEEAAA